MSTTPSLFQPYSEITAQPINWLTDRKGVRNQ